MHERSLIQALLAQVACLQAEHEGSTVQEIAVAVGPLSGVEPELLEMAFQELSNDDARLVIERVPLSVICRNCQATSTMMTFTCYCPCCTSTDLQITGGDAFHLLHVTLEAASNDSAGFRKSIHEDCCQPACTTETE